MIVEIYSHTETGLTMPVLNDDTVEVFRNRKTEVIVCNHMQELNSLHSLLVRRQ